MQMLNSYDNEVERLVINNLILNSDTDKILSELNPDMFYNLEHKKVFEKSLEIINESKEIDFLLLKDKGVNYEVILDIAEATSHIHNLSNSIDIIKKHHTIRQTGEAIVRLQKNITDDTPGSISNLVTSLLDTDTAKTKTFSAYDLTSKVFKLWDDNSKRRNFVRFGLPDIDKYLKVRAGNLLYVIAPPKTGKTWMLIAMAVNLAHQGYSVNFISAEMVEVDLWGRVMAYVSGVDTSQFDEPDTSTKRAMIDIEKKVEIISKLPIKITNAIGINSSQLLMELRKSKEQVVIIDYFQKINVSGDLRIGLNTLSAGISNYGKKNNKLMIVASQAGRTAQKNKITETYDGKETSNIEADADALIALTDKTQKGKEGLKDIDISITQRNGEGCYLKLKLNKVNGHWGENYFE